MSTFLHSGDIGDVLHCLPTIRALGGGKLYLCTRPFTKEMTPARFEAVSALIRAQPYITGCEMHKGQKIKYDFTLFRKNYYLGTGRNLATMQAGYINTSLPVDLRTPWITVQDPIMHGRPVIARSPRYQNEDWDKIWPEILREYPDPIFIGLKCEHEQFEDKYGAGSEYVHTLDFLHIARLIKGSPIFIGNQSSPMCVAEGMKHNAIQETYPPIKDVMFELSPTRYVLKYSQWKKCIERNKFAIMLQCFQEDIEPAQRLARLIVDLEESERDDIEFIVAARRGTDRDKVLRLVETLKTRFDVTAFFTERTGTGWPHGCNDLWQDAMMRIAGLRREGKLKSEAVFTLEPDCLPLRKDWISVLRAEWNIAKSKGHHFIGHLHGEPVTMNGNLITTLDALQRHPRLIGCSSDVPWDVAHAKEIIANGSDTYSIYQTERLRSLELEDFRAAKKHGKRPAIWHGIKSKEALEMARKELLTP